MPWDSLVKLLEASNKILFAGAVVGLVIWHFGFGFEPATVVVSGLVGLFCLCALIWEAVAAIIRWIKRFLEERARRLNLERIDKIGAEEIKAKQVEILRRINQLSHDARASLGHMVTTGQQEVTEASDNKVLRELESAELLEAKLTKPDIYRSHFRIEDFAWTHLHLPENLPTITQIKSKNSPPWNLPTNRPSRY